MKTLFVGKNSFAFEQLDSTNDWLLEQCNEASLMEGLVVRAIDQKKGKGQRGALWLSQSDKSLCFSILLKPKFLSTSQNFQLSLCVALGVYDCLSELRPGFSIKWPNDIYFENKKIAGILIENQFRKSTYQNAVVGIGLNINQNKFNALPNAISLKQILGIELTIESVLERLCETIEARYLQLRSGKHLKQKSDYLSHLFRFDKWDRYKIGEELFLAKIVDVLPNGRLCLNFENGSINDYDIKEVTFEL